MIVPRKQFHPAVASSVELTLAGDLFSRRNKPEHSPHFAPQSGKLNGIPLPRPPTLTYVTIPFVGPRCRVKGCVFPESELAEGRCHFHDLEDKEPALFESVQPILQVLSQAKFGLAG